MRRIASTALIVALPAIVAAQDSENGKAVWNKRSHITGLDPF